EPLRGYRLLERVGEGAFGEVHRAAQPALAREVAVKVVHHTYADDPEFIRRFESEAQLVARLEHPRIVPLYDYWRDPDGAYLVMRFLRGGSARQPLDRGPLEPEVALRLEDPVPSVRDARPELPAAVDEVIRTAADKDPQRRFPDAPALAAAFRRALGGAVAASPLGVAFPDRASIALEPRNPYKGLRPFLE